MYVTIMPVIIITEDSAGCDCDGGCDSDEMIKIVLASGSPRRQELLKMLGMAEIRVIPPQVDEDIPPGLSPEEAVCKIALRKAENVAGMLGAEAIAAEPTVIIAADTLVYLDGQPLGKPGGEREAMAMLRRLSGRQHTVYTGVAVLCGEKQIVESEKTEVFFREIPNEEIEAYVRTGEPMDKAGAYGAQGRGAVFIERIEGDFFNVVGLPLCRLSLMLGSVSREPSP